MTNEQTSDTEKELEGSEDLPEEVKARIRRIAAAVLAANPELLQELPPSGFIRNEPT